MTVFIPHIKKKRLKGAYDMLFPSKFIVIGRKIVIGICDFLYLAASRSNEPLKE